MKWRTGAIDWKNKQQSIKKNIQLINSISVGNSACTECANKRDDCVACVFATSGLQTHYLWSSFVFIVTLASLLPGFPCGVLLAVSGLAGRSWGANFVSAHPLIHLLACHVDHHLLSTKLSFFPKATAPIKVLLEHLKCSQDLRIRSNNGGTSKNDQGCSGHFFSAERPGHKILKICVLCLDAFLGLCTLKGPGWNMEYFHICKS